MKATDIFREANDDIVGINAKLHVFSGYDQKVRQATIGYDPREEWGEEPDETNSMSPTEKVVLADIMLARWQAYRQAAMAEPELTPSSPVAPSAHPAA